MPAPWASNPSLLAKDLSNAGTTYEEIPKACLQRALVFFKATESKLGQIQYRPACSPRATT
jgi:hypothetical protein